MTSGWIAIIDGNGDRYAVNARAVDTVKHGRFGTLVGLRSGQTILARDQDFDHLVALIAAEVDAPRVTQVDPECDPECDHARAVLVGVDAGAEPAIEVCPDCAGARMRLPGTDWGEWGRWS